MYSKQAFPYIMRADSDLFEAYWKLSFGDIDVIVLIDENEKYCGLCTMTNFSSVSFKERSVIKKLRLGDICSSGTVIKNSDAPYRDAADIYATKNMASAIPVLDESNNIIDVLSKKRVFYLDYFARKALPRMHYAMCLRDSAVLAEKLGYDRISAIEFGVSQGNGLINLEFHANEIERLYHVAIDIYGFDSGEGLPNDNDARNLSYMWCGGRYVMDETKLEPLLTRSELVIGDIADTTKGFCEKYDIAPIGAMFIDVDYYTSTLPILGFLNNEESYFLPRISSYFDDLLPSIDGLGESLAIREFNQANMDKGILISPEGCYSKLKTIHRLNHPNYTTQIAELDNTTNLRPL